MEDEDGEDRALLGGRREADSAVHGAPRALSALCDPSRLAHRLVVLSLMCFLGFGSYFCYDNPAALQTQVKRDMQVNTTKFMLLYAWYSWPNVVLCFLGGFLIDRIFGIRWGTVIFSCFVCIGQVIFALGGIFNAFWLMELGRFVFGIGGEFTLLFVHRDLSRDRPLALLMHLLQLGPLYRCCEVFCIYCQSDQNEEPYVSITKKRQMPKDGLSEEVEKEVGQAEGKLITHRSAFSRASVIQAFLGSAPQLTLQLYITVLEQNITTGRCFIMTLSLLSIVYGALRCNILAIKIKYDEYEVKVKPLAYVCIFLWRSFEIATRVIVLVLFTSVLKIWVVAVILVNFFSFF